MAIDCLSVKQHIATLNPYYEVVPESAKNLLAGHLKKLMRAHSKLHNRPALAKASGVSARAIGYMLQPSKGNPTIDSVEAVAAAFGLRAWEMLIDQQAEKERLMGKIFGTIASAPPAVESLDAPNVVHQQRAAYRTK